MIKLLATDVDGTLYNRDDKISRKNKRAIKKCLDKGIKVMLSTGRGIFSAKKIIGELGLKNYHVLSNGTLIVDENLNRVEHLTLKKDSYRKIVELSRKLKEQLVVATLDGYMLFEKDYLGLENELEKENSLKVADLLSEDILGKVLLCTIITEDSRYIDCKGFNLGDDIKIRNAGPNFTNFINKNAGKTYAIKKVIKKLGITTDEFMAVGDGENDLGMIKLARIGVAMGNASEEIKMASDYTVSDNENDGLAEAIEKFLGI